MLIFKQGPANGASYGSAPVAPFTAEEARSWLAAIVDSADDAIIGKDLHGVVRSWNRAATRIFGYTAEEMTGTHVIRLIPPELHHEEQMILSRIRAGERVDHYETVRMRKDGSCVPVSLTVSPVRDAEGRIVGASKIVHDASFDRQARAATVRLGAIVDSSDDAIIGKDLTGHVTSWNAAAERLYGYTADEMIGSSVLKIIPPDLLAEEAEILAAIQRGEKIDHYETVRMNRTGERIEVSLTVSPIRDGSGTVVGASKIARDVRGQRKGERAEAFLAAIIRSSDDAIISKDLKGVVLSWNPAAERLYGFSAEEMVGRSILRVVPPELSREEDFILDKICSGERIEHYSTQRVRKDGRRVFVSLTVSPIRDVAGNIVGASKIARDVSGEADAQRRKDEFLAVLAHELRNPLAPVRAAISLFGAPGVSEAQLAAAKRIADRQIAHMARLLDDLLDITRITTGRVELKRGRMDLRESVEVAVDAARSLMESKRHRLTIELPPEPVFLDADVARISQIVANLLTNSAKYTPDGGDIELRCERQGRVALVTVRDSGIGFDPEMAGRLFTLFSQDRRATSRAAGGLGIGLALVKEFVERHGGTVSAQSGGHDQGSTFIVRLPCEEAGATAPAD